MRLLAVAVLLSKATGFVNYYKNRFKMKQCFLVMRELNIILNILKVVAIVEKP